MVKFGTRLYYNFCCSGIPESLKIEQRLLKNRYGKFLFFEGLLSGSEDRIKDTPICREESLSKYLITTIVGTLNESWMF